MEPKRTPKGQSNLEKKKQSWRYNAAWFQAMLQNHGSPNCAVLANVDTQFSEINPHWYEQLIYDRVDKKVKWEN